MPKRNPLIAIVEDDDSVREATTGLMRSVGFSVKSFSSAENFLNASSAYHTDCLVADVNMPGMSGLDLHRRLVEEGKAIPTILITAYPDDRVRARAISAGVLCYLAKPFDGDDLLRCVRSALDRGTQDES